MLKKRWIVFAIIFVLFLQTGCSKKNTDLPAQNPADADNSRQRLENTSPATPESPKAVNPLTGLQDMDEIYSNQRPLAVMIENEYHARPQSGLDKAGVVYEVLAEGGITRFLAIFLGADVREVGPVRSARPYFIDYAMEYDGIYVHYGASPQGYSDIKKLKINDIDGIYDSVTFWRDSSRKEPHNAYSSTEKMLKTSEKRGYLKPVDLKAWKFNEKDAAPDGEVMEQFKLTYFNNYRVSYTYDSGKKAYERFINGSPHVDRVTGQPIFVKNIIIQFNDTKVTDKQGRLEIKTTGSGNAYYISDGFCTEIKWKKSSRSARTIYTMADGAELKINPGNTWIQVLPQWGKFDRGQQ
ncbi:MAG: DUF3048 domain-containing protein [Tepidanaerobacteraceae bacterium]|jgi:hypothetical protein|nr:DUF3048 domain-containing protein [Tepidanaerobacteraceae bacterium]